MEQQPLHRLQLVLSEKSVYQISIVGTDMQNLTLGQSYRKTKIEWKGGC